MKHLALLLAHEALRQAARSVSRLASLPSDAAVSFRTGPWVELEAPDGGWSRVMWPGDPGEYIAEITRGRLFTVVATEAPDGGDQVFVTLARDEVTGSAAEALREMYAAL